MLSATVCRSALQSYDVKTNLLLREYGEGVKSWQTFFSTRSNHTVDKYLSFRSYVSKTLYRLLCEYDQAITGLVVGQDSINSDMHIALEGMNTLYENAENDIVHNEITTSSACRRSILDYRINMPNGMPDCPSRDSYRVELAALNDYLDNVYEREYLKKRIDILKSNELDIGISNPVYLTPGTRAKSLYEIKDLPPPELQRGFTFSDE